MQKTKGVKSVTLPLVNKQGTAVYTVVSTTTALGRGATGTSSIPARRRHPAGHKGKGCPPRRGTTAGYIDLADGSRLLPLVIVVVLALCFVLLLLAFRSSSCR